MSEENEKLEPAKAPTSLDALKESVEFVSDGRPLSSQFLSGLSRRLTNLNERQDLVQLAIDNHQMNRLADVFGFIGKLENRIFGGEDFEKEMAKLSPKDQIGLLTSLYKEAQVLSRYQRGLAEAGSTLNTPPDAIQSATEDQSNHEAINAHGAKIGAEGRERVRSFLEELQREAAVIEMKPVVDDDSD